MFDPVVSLVVRVEGEAVQGGDSPGQSRRCHILAVAALGIVYAPHWGLLEGSGSAMDIAAH